MSDINITSKTRICTRASYITRAHFRSVHKIIEKLLEQFLFEQEKNNNLHTRTSLYNATVSFRNVSILEKLLSFEPFLGRKQHRLYWTKRGIGALAGNSQFGIVTAITRSWWRGNFAGRPAWSHQRAVKGPRFRVNVRAYYYEFRDNGTRAWKLRLACYSFPSFSSSFPVFVSLPRMAEWRN